MTELTSPEVAAAVAVENVKKVIGGPGSGRGGYRPGSGRKKGGFAKRTQDTMQLADELGINPVEFLLRRMHDQSLSMKDRIDCAKAAAPYVCPRLAAVENRVTVTKSHEETLDDLDD